MCTAAKIRKSELDMQTLTNYELLLKYSAPPKEKHYNYINIIEKETRCRGCALKICGEEEVFIFYNQIEVKGKKVSKMEFNANYEIISILDYYKKPL